MGFEIEFKFIDIKDINKIQRIEKTEDTTFGSSQWVDSHYDITDEYCKDILKQVTRELECTVTYIGCTDRIGQYKFEIVNEEIDYIVVFQLDTYEWNLQLTVEIGYKDNPPTVFIEEYDEFLEKLKLNIKDRMIRDWYKCIWIKDNQSMHLSGKVYSYIYMAENELRAFISKVMLENFGADWYDKPEFNQLNANIQKNAANIKRSVPNFANIDVNIYTATLECLMTTVKADIYEDTIPDTKDIQKTIKSRIFAATQTSNIQSILDFFRGIYHKKYNVWEKCFLPFVDNISEWDKLLHNFIENRNHVAHNKLLDFRAMSKMINDTEAFRNCIKRAVEKFDSEIISIEVEDTLQIIEEQNKYEREALREIIESEAGVTIRDKEEIIKLFKDTIDTLYIEIGNILYFDEVLDIEKKNFSDKITDEQLVIAVKCGREKILCVFAQVDIDDSEGAISTLKISVVAEDEDIINKTLTYTNGEAEYNSEQANYMAVSQDFYDEGNIGLVKSAIERFLKNRRESLEIIHYCEEEAAKEDWKADQADILEERN